MPSQPVLLHEGDYKEQYVVQTITSTKKPHNTVPFNVAKHLSIPQKLGEVDVKHVT